MSEYRRYFVPGGTYFFTLVTAQRAPLFHSSEARKLLGETMRMVCMDIPFNTVAIILLPDHIHTLWTLPTGDSDYSTRWKTIKAHFTIEWLKRGHKEAVVPDGYSDQRRRGIWQPRFMEHTIRDELDLQNHADYIHYNPVKHGYVSNPRDWPWSSFHRYVRSGDYDINWGAADQPPPDFGNIDDDLME